MGIHWTVHKDQANEAFTGVMGLSENLFIERWYQLLKPGTGELCCVLPESIFDTDSQIKTRLFLIAHFHIEAIISLPYLTFQPYTGVKTCVIWARKRTTEQIEKLEKVISCFNTKKDIKKACSALINTGIGNELLFFAEPQEVGYKRRKGLADLSREDDLPQVLHAYSNSNITSTLRYGFRTTLENVLSRDTIRLDPKYRWLWDKLNGCIRLNNSTDYYSLKDYIRIVVLEKLKKGELDPPRYLIDLDNVHSKCNGLVEDSVMLVDEIGSDKVTFNGADIIISKLEPYLAKCVVKPDPEAIGTTEWVGFKCINVDPVIVGYLISRPEMREAMRMLQSGKRHARLNPKELLELKFNKNISDVCVDQILAAEKQINDAKKAIEGYRQEIDCLFN